MSENAPTPGEPARSAPFDASLGHHARPKLRRHVQGSAVPVKLPDGQQQMMLALGDASQVADRQVVTSPLAQFILPQMTGDQDISTIVARSAEVAQQNQQVPPEAVAQITTTVVEGLVAQLDHAGLLEGPTFDQMLSDLREAFDRSPTLPPGASANIADALVAHEIGQDATAEQKAEQGPGKLRAQINAWIDQALTDVEDPSLDTLPRAVIAPHLDYFRGWLNYAHVYGRMRVVDPPDRVLILGTNHFGFGTGVVGCDKGFESPLGTCALDGEFLDAITAHLGEEQAERYLAHRYDHEREHSIELHVPWLAHVFGGEQGEPPKVAAALVHDPSPNAGASADGQGVDFDTFVDAAARAIDQMPGSTLIIASADLSHVGRSFGDAQPVAGDSDDAKAFRQKVIEHDREMLALVQRGAVDELTAAMAWQQNPTRWCSVGNISAAVRITNAESVRMLNYAAAGDSQGMALVSSCAAVID